MVDEFAQVLWAIKETLVARSQIDELIEQHGGWPEAFSITA